MSRLSDIRQIPGIGKIFEQDLARIGILTQNNLIGKNPEELFTQLCLENAIVNHKTSKNYLYVLRFCVYYAEGGREESKLKWSAWKD